jgi:FkbM family methyltransferase
VGQLIEQAARLAESHPFVWKLAWEAVHRLPMLLPHDKSYNALRHFIAAAPDGLFLDVGANDGISALSFRKFDKGYRILSVEPNLLLEPALKRIKAQDARFDYVMAGAGAVPGRAHFYVPRYKHVVLHTFTSGSRAQVEEALATSFGEGVARHAVIDSVENDVIRLDDLHLSPTIVKIDAEGFDYEVLQGLAETISRARPFIVLEIAWAAADEIVGFFNERDYVVLGYGVGEDRFYRDARSLYSAASGHRNSFAVPREKCGGLPIAEVPRQPAE